LPIHEKVCEVILSELQLPHCKMQPNVPSAGMYHLQSNGWHEVRQLGRAYLLVAADTKPKPESGNRPKLQDESRL